MLVARLPLQALSTSAVQMGSRRLSARLQEKDDAQSKGYETRAGGPSSMKVAEDQSLGSRGGQKRKNNYDEEDDGFTFSRVNKNKRPRQSKLGSQAEPPTITEASVQRAGSKKPTLQDVAEEPAASITSNIESGEIAKKKRKKMSFSTPKGKLQDIQPVRRSKRLSNEAARRLDSPTIDPVPIENKPKRKDKHPIDDETKKAEVHTEGSSVQTRMPKGNSDQEHSATKIALPYADTPVIRRNKAMREGKGAKGDRRSSLGLRGRRASSLIETGNSNALPHQEVDTNDFYKHIESDRIETSRMRQLLTWCATRAMHAKPIGTDFEDASAKSAARVIEEELLKELSNKSELSDWFSREDVPEPPKVLPERPNPKNVQNLKKIIELEEQIRKLKLERDALQQLLRPPVLTEAHNAHDSAPASKGIDRSLLSAEDAAILDVLESSKQDPQHISQRINKIGSDLGPSIDSFADSIHKVAQYRTATDKIAGKVLSICAGRMAERERDGRRKALQIEDDRSPGRDLSNVLRGLSKAER